MMLAAISALGLLASAAALALTRAAGLRSTGPDLPDPFGLALARLAGWLALVALLLAALLAFGVPAGAAGAAVALPLALALPPAAIPAPAFRLTLPLALGAFVLAILALAGVLNLIQGTFSNG